MVTWGFSSALEGEVIPLERLAGEKILFLCGIANPAPLIKMLQSQIQSLTPLELPDHGTMNLIQQRQVINFIRNGGIFLTTAKDWVKLVPGLKARAQILQSSPVIPNFFPWLKGEVGRFLAKKKGG